MIDPDTNPTQDTEHHLRDGGELLAKVLPAGGPLLGQEPCPSCGHFPGEPRDNPFRACVTCGSKAA